MKLAEALAERGDCRRRLDEIKERLNGSARIQEGEQPAEDPAELLAETDQVYAQLLELIRVINRTNSQTASENERTNSDVLAESDVMSKRREFLSDIAGSATSRWDRYSKSEVGFVITIPVGKIRSEADQIAKGYRELELRIQELNWKTELVWAVGSSCWQRAQAELVTGPEHGVEIPRLQRTLRIDYLRAGRLSLSLPRAGRTRVRVGQGTLRSRK